MQSALALPEFAPIKFWHVATDELGQMFTDTQPAVTTKSVAPATKIPTSSPASSNTPLPEFPANESRLDTQRYEPSGDWDQTFATCAPAYFRGNPDGCPI
jgi:hypothetical protein